MPDIIQTTAKRRETQYIDLLLRARWLKNNYQKIDTVKSYENPTGQGINCHRICWPDTEPERGRTVHRTVLTGHDAGRTTSSDSGHFTPYSGYYIPITERDTELEKLTGHGNEHSTGQLSIVWTQALFTQALFTYRYKPCSRVGTNTVHVQT